MAEFKGEVAFLDSREITSKKSGRKFTAYSLKLKLDDGELSQKIDCGFEQPPFKKGDYVAVKTEVDAKGYEQLKFIEAASRPAARAASVPNAGAVAGATGAAAPEQLGADRQTQIVLQHSQEMAIAEVALLLANNALPLSAATSKAGQAKRYEELHAAVQKLTVELYFDVVSARLLDKVADAGNVVVSTAALPNSNNTETTTGEDD